METARVRNHMTTIFLYFILHFMHHTLLTNQISARVTDSWEQTSQKKNTQKNWGFMVVEQVWEKSFEHILLVLTYVNWPMSGKHNESPKWGKKKIRPQKGEGWLKFIH